MNNICSTPGIMNSWVKENIPEVVHSARILNDNNFGFIERNIVHNQTKYNINNPLIVDYDFFSIFSFGILSGEVNSFATDKYSVTLSKPLAERVFGNKNPIGEAIKYKGETFTIRAVMEEIPKNSSIRFDILLPASHVAIDTILSRSFSKAWGNVEAIIDQLPSVSTCNNEICDKTSC